MLGAPFFPGSGQGFSPAELSLAAQYWDLAQGTQRLGHTEATLSLSAPSGLPERPPALRSEYWDGLLEVSLEPQCRGLEGRGLGQHLRCLAWEPVGRSTAPPLLL